MPAEAEQGSRSVAAGLPRFKPEGFERVIVLTHELGVSLGAVKDGIDRLASAALSDVHEALLLEHPSQGRNRINVSMDVIVKKRSSARPLV